MANYNIQMTMKNSSGSSDNVYPVTKSKNVEVAATSGINISASNAEAVFSTIGQKLTEHGSSINTKASQTDLNLQKARLDNLLAAGSTGTDELKDIRVTVGGTTATTAGTAVRQQITDSKNILRQLMPEYTSSRWRNSFSPNYRVQSWCYDKITGRYFIIGNATAKNGNAMLTVTTDIRNFSDARQYVVKTGHSNDITYNYDNQKLYVTCGNAPSDGGAEGNVPNNAIAEIETTNFTLVKYYTLDVDVTCRVEYIGDNKFVAGDFTYGSIYNSNFSQKLSSKIFKWGESFYIDPIYGISADTTASQTCCTDGEYLYVIYAGAIHDQSTGLAWNDGYFVVKFGMDGRFVDYSFASFKRPGAEAEGCFIKDDKIYVCTDGNFADFTWANLHGGRYETPEGFLANDNLNDLLRPGTYFANTADKAKTIINNPGVTYAGFTVVVEINDNKGVVQKLIPANTVALEYRRVFYNGTWGQWYLFGAKLWTLSNNAYVVSGHIYPSTDTAGGTVLVRCTLPFCFKSLNLTRIRGILRGVNGNIGDFDLKNINIDVTTTIKTVTVDSNVYIKIVRNPGDFISIEYWFKSAPNNYVEYTPVTVQLNLTGTAIGNQ